MFNITKFSKKATDKVLLYMNFFDDNPEQSRFGRFIIWYGYKFQPFFINIAMMVVFFYIIHRIYGKYDFERTMIWLIAVLILTMRGLSNKISEILEKFK